MRIKLSSRMHISNQNGLFYLLLAYQDVEITVDLMEVAESKESDFVDGCMAGNIHNKVANAAIRHTAPIWKLDTWL